MATPSRFNRPYGNSAQGQASWEKINRPDRQLGDQSLANQPATASGRGYYDPARILERVARGRPGATMQQAQGAILAEGYKDYEKLRSQMGQQQQQQPDGNRLSRNRGEGDVSIGGTVPQGAQLLMGQQPTPPPPNPMNPAQPQQKRGGIGSYLDMMTQGWNALGAAAKPFGL